MFISPSLVDMHMAKEILSLFQGVSGLGLGKCQVVFQGKFSRYSRACQLRWTK
jgi:hypothetical protein